MREYLPLQPGDVPNTFADASALEAAVGFRPATPMREGVARFVDWYLEWEAEALRGEDEAPAAEQEPALEGVP